MSHPNILSFLGFHIDPSSYVAYFVCDWLPAGNISQYLQSRPRDDIDRLELVRSRYSYIHFHKGLKASYIYQIRDTAEGLGYLHQLDPPVCHGDIKAVSSIPCKCRIQSVRSSNIVDIRQMSS